MDTLNGGNFSQGKKCFDTHCLATPAEMNWNMCEIGEMNGEVALRINLNI